MKDYQLSLVAIFRNEHRYIVEWLEYHLKIGVEHFYLYDNGGDHREVLAPFMAYITYTLWTDDIAQRHIGESDFSRQTMAYKHCVKKFSKDTNWLQLIDLDEYLVPMDSTDLEESLKKHASSAIGKLRIPRFNFGNNGHWKSPTGGSINACVRRERRYSHHKDMGRSSAIKRVNGPHSFRVRGVTLIPDNLRIYHHYTRSMSEWVERTKTGGGQTGKGFRVMLSKNSWLTHLAFFVLNLRSIYVFISLHFLNIILIALNANGYLYLLHLPLIGLGIFAFRKGQNEVKDERLVELMNS